MPIIHDMIHWRKVYELLYPSKQAAKSRFISYFFRADIFISERKIPIDPTPSWLEIKF